MERHLKDDKIEKQGLLQLVKIDNPFIIITNTWI